MEHKVWITMDKTSWAPGPWLSEPDKEQWADEATGLPCLIKRGRFGSLCGYVGVSEGHPWFGEDPSGIEAEAHGGLNYGNFCQEGPVEHTICHVPAPGEPDRVYWLGFDCGHAWDISPAMDALLAGAGLEPPRAPGMSYKTIAYVKAECAQLARQAAEAAPGTTKD
jgi:hypothetical protein